MYKFKLKIMNKHSVKTNNQNLKYFVYVLIIAALAFGIYKLVTAPKIDAFLITPTDHIEGNIDAKVTMIEYSDFQCPACGSYYPVVQDLVKSFPQDLRLVYRNYPLLTVHDKAMLAARVAEAAAQQGKFWEMHDLLFEEQNLWSKMQTPMTRFEYFAKSLNLDLEKFKDDVNNKSNSSDINKKISFDMATANSLGVSGTPSFFVNGKKIDSPSSLEEFKKLIEEEIKTAI